MVFFVNDVFFVKCFLLNDFFVKWCLFVKWPFLGFCYTVYYIWPVGTYQVLPLSARVDLSFHSRLELTWAMAMKGHSTFPKSLRLELPLSARVDLSNGNEGALHIPQISKTGASLSVCLMSYPGHSFEGSLTPQQRCSRCIPSLDQTGFDCLKTKCLTFF